MLETVNKERRAEMTREDEIEARLEALEIKEDAGAALNFLLTAPDDIRYLLDRVAELEAERTKYRAWVKIEMAGLRGRKMTREDEIRLRLEEFSVGLRRGVFFAHASRDIRYLLDRDDTGTTTSRFSWLMKELERRFPDMEPWRSDEPPEVRYLKYIDTILGYYEKGG